jgi:hypothetical protein
MGIQQMKWFEGDLSFRWYVAGWRRCKGEVDGRLPDCFERGLA